MRRVPLLPVVGVLTIADGAEGHDTGIQPGVAHVGDAAHRAAALLAFDFDRVNVGAVRGVPLEFIPAFDGAGFQFVLVADDVVVSAIFTDPDGQRKPPVALF